MNKYRYETVPEEIEALQFNRNNVEEVKEFLGSRYKMIETPRNPDGISKITYYPFYEEDFDSVTYTLSSLYEGQYIVRDSEGELSTMHKEVFEKYCKKL